MKNTDEISCDVAVIGAGPGGCTAAMYCARAGYDTRLLERLAPGGQMSATSSIENYPGFDESVDGIELAEKMKLGAERAGAVYMSADVKSVEFSAQKKLLYTKSAAISARAAVIATGARPRTLGVPGESELIGHGVGYCAACDGMLYRGRDVAVIGGGNSAAEEAVFLSRICRRVYIVHRRGEMRASKAYLAPLSAAGNIEFIWNSTVSGFEADETLHGLKLKSISGGGERTLVCDGVFVAIGRVPATELFSGAVELDGNGYIRAGESTETSAAGVFAVGDVRTKELRQIVTAAADGAAASYFIEQYLK